jgi:hypothetical protein
MTSTPSNQRVPIWTGRLLSGLVITFLLVDGAIKLVPIQPVTDTLQALGFVPTNTLARGLGILLLLCTALYAFPRSSLVGAVLLTGYLGGAVAIQIRANNPLFTHVLFSFYVGIAMWAGLILRDSNLRSLLLARI